VSRRAKRILSAATVAAIVVSLGLALSAWHSRAGAHAKLVLIGGAANPCACTQRIEP
jgi:hypothetical protein